MSQGPAAHRQIRSLVSHIFVLLQHFILGTNDSLLQFWFFFFWVLFFFSTSHFLMPIFQEKFPFIQKSSRALVRYTYTKIMKQEKIAVWNIFFIYILYILKIYIYCLPQECYVHNLLRVTVYLPSIRRDVLELVIGKMLQLDVSHSESDTMEIPSTAEWEKKIVTTNLCVCVWCISGQCFSDRYWGRRVHSYGEPSGPAPERGGTVWHGINIKHFLIQ